MAVTTRPKPRKRWYSDLFFVKRRPFLRGIGVEWERPSGDDDYQKLIHQEGFVSRKYWDGGDLSNLPTITQDLKDLEQYLLPSFFEFSQKSRYYQNNFYLYQWVFALGAFFTTLFGTLAATIGVLIPTDSGVDVGRVLSYMTAIIGAITAYYTTLSNRGEPQKRWGKTRRLSEELRMNYFLYLSHLAPFDKDDRVQKLRETVIDCRVKEQENG